MGPGAMVGAMSGRAEGGAGGASGGAGIDWGPLKSAEKPCPWGWAGAI